MSQALNDHINVEFTASYAYQALFAYFDRDTVALKGFAEFFRKQSAEVFESSILIQPEICAYVIMNLQERDHAEEFMKYQNKRGGKVWPPQQPFTVPAAPVFLPRSYNHV